MDYKKLIRIFILLLMLILSICVYYLYNKKPSYVYLPGEIIIKEIIKEKEVIVEVEVEPETVYIEVEKEEMSYNYYSTVQLNVNSILQNPELPTGCEVTSLAIVLNYLGYDIDKVTLSDLYMPKGEIGKTNPDEAFIGNPKTTYSYGANAPVMIKTANNYFNHISSNYIAYNVSTSDFKSLLKYINNGYPVMIWATMSLIPSYPSDRWIVDNQEVQWYANEHCMVLIGYTKDQYIFADPLKGIVRYNKGLVEQRYNELGNQAVVIY